MNQRLLEWNTANIKVALDEMLACCGAERWAGAMVKARPVKSAVALSATADRLWGMMEEPDWLEAFACHPRIGERNPAHTGAKFASWSRQEQSLVEQAQTRILADLAAGNARYEEQFGFTYIVCASGKSAQEMLDTLQRRLANDRASELREAAEQQRQILQIRLGKWLSS